MNDDARNREREDLTEMLLKIQLFWILGSIVKMSINRHRRRNMSEDLNLFPS
jgi:hypothetical protein